MSPLKNYLKFIDQICQNKFTLKRHLPFRDNKIMVFIIILNQRDHLKARDCHSAMFHQIHYVITTQWHYSRVTGSKTPKLPLKLTFANFTPNFATVLAHKPIKRKQICKLYWSKLLAPYLVLLNYNCFRNSSFPILFADSFLSRNNFEYDY